MNKSNFLFNKISYSKKINECINKENYLVLLLENNYNNLYIDKNTKYLNSYFLCLSPINKIIY